MATVQSAQRYKLRCFAQGEGGTRTDCSACRGTTATTDWGAGRADKGNIVMYTYPYVSDQSTDPRKEEEGKGQVGGSDDV